jgi:hypothetical protein
VDTLWTASRNGDSNGLGPAQTQSTGCAGEKIGHLFQPGYPQENPQAASSCLWKRCEKVAGQGFTERVRPVVHRHAETAGRAGQRYGWPTARNSPSPASGAGYHSPVRSNTGDEIGRIASAIDQLESDARNTADQAELTSRIAMLWQMVSALDPELARRAQLYTAPPGGTPSA